MRMIEMTVTGPADWTERCVADLLEAKLIAAVHMWPIKSRYWWQGSIRTADEIRSAMHTLETNVSTVAAVVQESHPYVVACVISHAISPINPLYSDWLIDSLDLPNRSDTC